jgi:TolA-binding protein
MSNADSKPLLSEEEALIFASINQATLQRYINAGFITPKSVGEDNFYDQEELIKAFDLAPQKANAKLKNKSKHVLSPVQKISEEKDRIVADKDMQIRDLKDQRAWLQARVERLEEELATLKDTISIQSPLTENNLPITHVNINKPLLSASEINPNHKKSSVKERIINYLGKCFGLTTDINVNEPFKATTSLAPLQEQHHTTIESINQGDANKTVLSVDPLVTGTEENKSANDKITNSKGNRPFRDAKEAHAELLGNE